MQKTIFCANCQTDTAHSATVERGDIILTCSAADCGRFVKFPATMSAAELQAAVTAHKSANQGLQLLKTDSDVIEAGLMTEQQVSAALAAIEALG